MNIVHSIQKLKQLDPSLIDLFDSLRVNDLVPEDNYFKSLVQSIIYQQLSGKSARSIHNKFLSIYKQDLHPSPEQVLLTDRDILFSVGLSKQKANYVQNVARAFYEEQYNYDNLHLEHDGEIINILTKIKGIGVWTAQMFLIFTLNRPDVMPATDLAIQKGYQFYFKLNYLPKDCEIIERSKIWSPYRSTVSLHLWKILETPFEQ